MKNDLEIRQTAVQLPCERVVQLQRFEENSAAIDVDSGQIMLSGHHNIFSCGYVANTTSGGSGSEVSYKVSDVKYEYPNN